MNLPKIPLVVILAMVFAGLAGTYVTQAALKSEKTEKATPSNATDSTDSNVSVTVSSSPDGRVVVSTSNNSKPHKRVVFVHGNAYEVLDGGLYQEIKTGKFCNQNDVYDQL